MHTAHSDPTVYAPLASLEGTLAAASDGTTTDVHTLCVVGRWKVSRGASLSNGPRQVLASSVTGDERYTFGSNLTVNVCR